MVPDHHMELQQLHNLPRHKDYIGMGDRWAVRLDPYPIYFLLNTFLDYLDLTARLEVTLATGFDGVEFVKEKRIRPSLGMSYAI